VTRPVTGPVTGPVLVACSHGTADAEGTAAVTRLVDAVRRAADVPVVEAYVDVHGPYVRDVVAEHGGDVVVVPLLLAAGFHVRVDIAEAVAPWPAALTSPALGPDDRLTELLDERLRGAGVRPDDAVVLAAAGSSDDAADAAVRAQADLLSVVRGRPVTVAYGAARGPRIGEEVARLRDLGPRVAVASYLLATGHFHRRVLQAGADAVSAPLLDGDEPDARLVGLVLDRYGAALQDADGGAHKAR
jgi:sirohydrochlorin ferrochelatase